MDQNLTPRSRCASTPYSERFSQLISSWSTRLVPKAKCPLLHLTVAPSPGTLSPLEALLFPRDFCFPRDLYRPYGSLPSSSLSPPELLSHLRSLVHQQALLRKPSPQSNTSLSKIQGRALPTGITEASPALQRIPGLLGPAVPGI